MNELATYYVEFTSKGLAELKSALKDIEQKLDGLGSGAGKAGVATKGLIGGLTGLLSAIHPLAAALVAIGASIKHTFDVKNEIINLNNLADTLGVPAEELETMSIALKKYGGNLSDVASVYRRFTSIKTNLEQGQLDSGIAEAMARYGIDIKPGMSVQQMMISVSRVLDRLTQEGRHGERLKVAQAFGIPDAVLLFLSQNLEKLNNELLEATEQLHLSGEDNKKNALALQEAEEQLKVVWDSISIEWMPILTELMNNVLKPLLELLMPIAQWATKHIGGDLQSLLGLKDVIKGNKSWDNWLDESAKRNGIIGGMTRFGEKIGEGLTSVSRYNRLPDELKKQISGLMDEHLLGNLSKDEYSAKVQNLLNAAQTLGAYNTPISTNSVGSIDNSNTTYNSNPVTLKVKVGNEPEYTAAEIFPGQNQSMIMPAVNIKGVR